MQLTTMDWILISSLLVRFQQSMLLPYSCYNLITFVLSMKTAEEAFVGKGLYLKRLSYHAKGRCGVMVRPRCRLTVVVREATAEEEAKIAKLRVSNYKKLTRKERQLMPHRLIEVSPRWARKRKEEAGARA